MNSSDSVISFRHGVYLVGEIPPVATGELTAAQRLRYRVFVEARGWVEPAYRDARLDVDDYDPLACHFAVTDHLGETVGTIRLVRGGEAGFMLDKEFAALVDGDGKCLGHTPAHAELSRLAVKPELSPRDRHEVAMCLYRIAYQWSVAHGIDTWYVVVEPAYLTILQRLGFPFRPFGRPWKFQPEVVTVAASLDLGEAVRVLGNRDPKRLAWFQESPSVSP